MDKEKNDLINRTNNENVEVKPPKQQSWWQRKSHWGKVSFILSIVVLLLALTGIMIWIYSRELFGDEIGNRVLGYYLDGETPVYYNNGWEKIGRNLTSSVFNWLATFFIVAFAITLIFVVNVLTFLFTNKKSRKSQTIGSLIRSLVKYVGIIIAFGIILTVWGVDVVGVVAGVGILTLIIGLGCQSLIQDVVSGLFIVFDDYFAVGDIVIIDGFRGTITDVGLKTTKLQDTGGNIKSISNSQITTVTNLSRLDSMVIVKIGCAYEEDIVRVEGVIAGAMNDFKTKIPNITTGPFYKGIDAISASSIDFMVLCFCKEADRFQVTRDIKRELILLFRENNIIIPYTQISVNKENDSSRPVASDIEKAIALKATNENRGINNQNKKENKKKRNIFHKINESIQAAEDEND